MQKTEEVLMHGGHDETVAWLYQTVRRRQFYTARRTPAELSGSTRDAGRDPALSRCMCFRSEAYVRPSHALAAYVSRATTVAR